jgi:hypothetical protein
MHDKYLNDTRDHPVSKIIGLETGFSGGRILDTVCKVMLRLSSLPVETGQLYQTPGSPLKGLIKSPFMQIKDLIGVYALFTSPL